MAPILISLGRFELRTMSLFLVLAFFAAAFTFWRKSREEHYKEDEAFDGFLLSGLLGVLFSRIGYILLNITTLGLAPLTWLDVFSHPGSNFWIGLMAAGFFLYRYAQHQKWDTYEILDFWIMGVSCSLIFLSLGQFFDGAAFGLPTSLPWGVQLPGVFQKQHPVQLYFAFFYVLLFIYLSKVEYRYRTFSWYRAGKNTAQTGFLISVFTLTLGLFSFAVSFISPGTYVEGVRLDQVASAFTAGAGALMLYLRSGRSLNLLSFFSKKPDTLKHFKA